MRLSQNTISKSISDVEEVYSQNGTWRPYCSLKECFKVFDTENGEDKNTFSQKDFLLLQCTP